MDLQERKYHISISLLLQTRATILIYATETMMKVVLLRKIRISVQCHRFLVLGWAILSVSCSAQLRVSPRSSLRIRTFLTYQLFNRSGNLKFGYELAMHEVQFSCTKCKKSSCQRSQRDKTFVVHVAANSLQGSFQYPTL